MKNPCRVPWLLVILMGICCGAFWVLQQFPTDHFDPNDGPLACLQQFALYLPWADREIDWEIRSSGSVVLPISTHEEFLAVSGEDAFYKVEIWIRWEDGCIPEEIQACIQGWDAQEHPLSPGQVVTMQKQNDKPDSAGRICYRPQSKIILVGSPKMEFVTKDRVSVYVRADSPIWVILVD